jgi:hypothetical protein
MNRTHGVLGKQVILIMAEKMWNHGGRINFKCQLEFNSNRLYTFKAISCILIFFCFRLVEYTSILFFILRN